MSDERWRQVATHPGYEISDFGRARSHRPRNGFGPGPRILALTPTIRGYLTFNAARVPGGKQDNLKVHQEVLKAFVGARPRGMHACHYDGDKTNNRLSNLRWDTPSANAQDKVRHGRALLGSRNNRSRLSAANVQEIRELLKNGATVRGTARDYGVTGKAISSIRDGRTWKHLEGL